MTRTSWRSVATPALALLALGVTLASCSAAGAPTAEQKVALSGRDSGRVTTSTTTGGDTATTSPQAAATTTAPPCPQYSSTVYGVDPNQLAQTGGGSQLVTVVAPTSQSVTATFVAWRQGAGGCWGPIVFPGLPGQPFQAQTGSGGLLPIAQRVPGDYATPTGLYPFGTVVYGNAPASPTTLYPYHHLVCGDWWDEAPGSPTYDTFQHVSCDTTPAYAGDSEALWTEVQPYQHFIDIPMPNPPDDGAGIFLHDDMAVGYTEGCVALPNAELDAVLGWLNPADDPHILITVG